MHKLPAALGVAIEFSLIYEFGGRVKRHDIGTCGVDLLDAFVNGRDGKGSGSTVVDIVLPGIAGISLEKLLVRFMITGRSRRPHSSGPEFRIRQALC